MSIHPNSLANLRPDLAVRFTSETAPKGRKNAGLTLIEHINQLSDDIERGTLDRNDIRKIAREDPNLNRAAAAVQLLRRAENPDIADYDRLLSGEATIDDLRKEGVDTTHVKKLKRKRRTIRRKGETENVIEQEIELHNRAGDSFDRVANHTEGLPIQRTITQNTSVELTIQRKIVTDADVERAYRLLESAGNPVAADSHQQSIHPATDGRIRESDVSERSAD